MCKTFDKHFFFCFSLQVVLSMTVVHLHESDYVAADNCYKESFEYVQRTNLESKTVNGCPIDVCFASVSFRMQFQP